MKISSKHISLILVVALVLGAFVLRNFPFSGGALASDEPQISVTVDNFFHSYYAKWDYDSQSAQYTPRTWAAGDPKTLSVQPPFLYLFVASFAKLVNLGAFPIYSLYFTLICLLFVLMPLCTYILAKRYFNDEIALLSLALSLFPTINWLFQVYMGYSMDIMAFFFVPAAIFFLVYTYEHKSYMAAALVGLLLGASWLAHVVEATYTVAFIALFTLALILFKRIDKKMWRQLAVILVVFIAVIAYFYPVIRQSYLTASNVGAIVQLGKMDLPDHNYWPRLMPGILAGVVLLSGLFFFYQSYWSKKYGTSQLTILAFILFLFIVGNSYLVGISPNRSFRQLLSSYTFFTIIAAMGVYLAHYFLVKKTSLKQYSPIIIMLFCLAVPAATFNTVYHTLDTISAHPISSPAKWESMKWLAANTPENSSVFALYGFNHEYEQYSERLIFKGDMNLGYTQENILLLCNATMPERFHGQWGWWIPVGNFSQIEYLSKRTGYSAFEISQSDFAKKHPVWVEYLPLTDFDYVIFQQHGTQADPCLAFFRQQAGLRGYPVVYENSEMTIMKVAK